MKGGAKLRIGRKELLEENPKGKFSGERRGEKEREKKWKYKEERKKGR